jgi:outer membrane lipoprotein-sorting protein
VTTGKGRAQYISREKALAIGPKASLTRCFAVSSGRSKMGWKKLALAFLAVFASASASSEPREASAPLPEPTLEAFMEGMAATPGVVARFREVKELSLLSEPLESKGMLYFVPPDRLARVTTEPSRSRLVIDGDQVAFRDEAGGEVVDLSENAVAREFVANFIVLFNGDLDALRERYTPTLRMDGERWTLVLVPRQERLARVVERITLSGEGRLLDRMELLESDGDRTTTTFEATEIDRRFSAEELRRIFSVPGATGP